MLAPRVFFSCCKKSDLNVTDTCFTLRAGMTVPCLLCVGVQVVVYSGMTQSFFLF